MIFVFRHFSRHCLMTYSHLHDNYATIIGHVITFSVDDDSFAMLFITSAIFNTFFMPGDECHYYHATYTDAAVFQRRRRRAVVVIATRADAGAMPQQLECHIIFRLLLVGSRFIFD